MPDRTNQPTNWLRTTAMNLSSKSWKTTTTRPPEPTTPSPHPVETVQITTLSAPGAAICTALWKAEHAAEAGLSRFSTLSPAPTTTI